MLIFSLRKMFKFSIKAAKRSPREVESLNVDLTLDTRNFAQGFYASFNEIHGKVGKYSKQFPTFLGFMSHSTFHC